MIGYWLLVIGYVLLVIGYWLCVIGYLLFVVIPHAQCPMPNAPCPMPIFSFFLATNKSSYSPYLLPESRLASQTNTYLSKGHK
ncbi:hypothetical protein [Microcoleus vaginatus]|uniref:hypothetical protein n=1 Tax=Microcoleus vaginatus TaxID=119532 RepID=UPI004040C011